MNANDAMITNQTFSDVFRRYRKKPVVCNVLKTYSPSPIETWKREIHWYKPGSHSRTTLL